MSLLIVVSCSQRKVRTPATPIPAIDRYDGIFYQVLRKAKREGRWGPAVQVVIISAKFGVLRPTTSIPYYDQRMTGRQAIRLKPSVNRRLKRIIRDGRFARVCVNLGRMYEPLLSDLEELDNAIWASGGIGKRARTLKRWIDAGAATEKRTRVNA